MINFALIMSLKIIFARGELEILLNFLIFA